MFWCALTAVTQARRGSARMEGFERNPMHANHEAWFKTFHERAKNLGRHIVLPEGVDDQGEVVPPNTGGKLVLRKPWPGMLRGLWGAPDRYQEVYLTEVPGSYFTGDGSRQDKDGYFWIVGRIDDVLNVAGHRIGTAEVESAIVSNSQVAEAAVVGRPDQADWVRASAPSALVITGFLLNRLNVGVTGLEGWAGASYFPRWTELAVSISTVAAAVFAFGLAVRYLNVFGPVAGQGIRETGNGLRDTTRETSIGAPGAGLVTRA